MTWLGGKQKAKAKNDRPGRSQSPARSLSDSPPPEFYLSYMPQPLHDEPFDPEFPHITLPSPSSPSSPPPPLAAQPSPQEPVEVPAPPPIAEHPAFRHLRHSPPPPPPPPPVSLPFIPYSPSDYDLSSTATASSATTTPRLPPSPPISPPAQFPPPTFPRSPSPIPDNHGLKLGVAWPSQGPSIFQTYQPPQERYSRWRSLSDTRTTSTKITPLPSSASSMDTDPDLASETSEALSDVLSVKLDDVITSMDRHHFSGMESDLRKETEVFFLNSLLQRRKTTDALVDTSVVNQNQQGLGINIGGVETQSSSSDRSSSARTRKRSIGPLPGNNYFSKAYLYANSRLPYNLLPLKLYIPTYPLICLAAQFSQQVYSKPSGAERETHVPADHKKGTKAMVIKSVPVDNMNVIVFAVRGTHTFRDWTTNMNSDPIAPDGFLDDTGNLCHSGFLMTARRMVPAVAARLQQLLDESPSRASYSLVITGHSAGGAIASLLYAHMLSQTLLSELITLRDRFKRVHCVTFGAPPVSILPLDKPPVDKYSKWLFFSFINEGDPVARAEKSYLRCLIDLYTSPAPHVPELSPKNSSHGLKLNLLGKKKKAAAAQELRRAASTPAPVFWKTPPATFSLAGRLVLLRGSRTNPKGKNHVEAFLTRDEDFRGVIFGDPMMHMMELYERRVEILATNAVTAKFTN